MKVHTFLKTKSEAVLHGQEDYETSNTVVLLSLLHCAIIPYDQNYTVNVLILIIYISNI